MLIRVKSAPAFVYTAKQICAITSWEWKSQFHTVTCYYTTQNNVVNAYNFKLNSIYQHCKQHCQTVANTAKL